MFSQCIKVLSFAGSRPEMDEYFKKLKDQGYQYAGDLLDGCPVSMLKN